MNNSNTIVKILLIVFTISINSCKSEITKPIPDKHPELSQGEYDKYIGLLQEAYDVNNNFDAALQLANLKAKKSVLYQLLNLSVKEEPDRCDKIYKWYRLYDKQNFGVNILKLDTIQFKKTVSLCDKISQNNSYQEYSKIRDEEEKQAKENKPVEDSTNFNIKLVTNLKQIINDDQEIRKKISAKNIIPDLERELRKEMQVIDSINLEKIDKIFRKHGYPSREMVGKDGNFTPALVIHHSNSLETRYKYLPFLEKAVEDGLLGEGTLNMIKRRIENMELNSK